MEAALSIQFLMVSECIVAYVTPRFYVLAITSWRGIVVVHVHISSTVCCFCVFFGKIDLSDDANID